MSFPHPILPAIRFCPACGGKEISFTQKSVQCGTCGFELFFNPAAAAGILLRDKHGRLLLVRRALEPSKGKLGAPGGFTDCGETSEETAVRELYEETGLKLSVEALTYLCSAWNLYAFNGVQYLSEDSYFTAIVDNFESACALSEVRELVALTPSEIQDDMVAFPSLRYALNVYRKKESLQKDSPN